VTKGEVNYGAFHGRVGQTKGVYEKRECVGDRKKARTDSREFLLE
jgi:hypothetical protein